MRSAITAPTNERAPLGATLQDWNHFDLVLGLGADLLPVVPDPNAQPGPYSKIKKFGKIPSCYDAAGTANGIPGWQSRPIRPEQIEEWSHDRRLGMCVRTGEKSGVYAIDVDTSDPEQAQRIAECIERLIGVLPRRERANNSKFLLLFRLKP